MMEVNDNRVVYIRYTMKNLAGELLENTLEGTPIGFLFGSPNIHADLQLQLKGFRAGDKLLVYLKLSPYENFVFDLIIDEVRAATDTEIMLGYPLQSAQKCAEDCACYGDSVQKQSV